MSDPSAHDHLAAARADVARLPEDARAAYALANALYDRGLREEAVTWWEKAAKLDRSLVPAWRKLGAAYFNVYKDLPAAQGAYKRALSLNADDEAVLFERDQLAKLARVFPAERLTELEERADAVQRHDGLTTEIAALYNQMGDFARARETLLQHRFDAADAPRAAEQYRRAEVGRGRQALWRGEEAEAIFAGCWHLPENFPGTRLDGNAEAELYYWIGMARRAKKDVAAAAEAFEKAVAADRANVTGRPGVSTFFAAASLRQMGRDQEAETLFAGIEAHTRELTEKAATVDTYAGPPLVETPFDHDYAAQQEIYARLLKALAHHGLHERKAARRLLGDILRDDPNHALAADFLIWLEWS